MPLRKHQAVNRAHRLAACEIVKRKATIDARLFTKAEVLAARPTNIKTGQPITEEDLTKDEYTGKDFDDELSRLQTDWRAANVADKATNMWIRIFGLLKFIPSPPYSVMRGRTTDDEHAESEGLRTGLRRKPDSIPMIADNR